MKRFLFALLSLPISALADGGLPNQPYIYVMGSAEIEKPADMVTLRFNLVARAADQVKANQQVQANANKILTLLDGRKIAAQDVIAGDLSSEPEYQETESSRTRGKLIDYKVTRPFVIKVRDVTTFPKLVDDFLATEGAEFSGIDAGLSNEKQLQDDVGEKALTNARERAEKTLKTMGAKIDSVFAVSPVAFPEIESDIFGTAGTVMGVRSSENLKAPNSPQYRLAPVTVSQSVHVIYLISPAK